MSRLRPDTYGQPATAQTVPYRLVPMFTNGRTDLCCCSNQAALLRLNHICDQPGLRAGLFVTCSPVQPGGFLACFACSTRSRRLLSISRCSFWVSVSILRWLFPDDHPSSFSAILFRALAISYSGGSNPPYPKNSITDARDVVCRDTPLLSVKWTWIEKSFMGSGRYRSSPAPKSWT
jgi:hypothetical protein